jgi:hypothetical protein
MLINQYVKNKRQVICYLLTAYRLNKWHDAKISTQSITAVHILHHTP